jgi:hypothetical protein
LAFAAWEQNNSYIKIYNVKCAEESLGTAAIRFIAAIFAPINRSHSKHGHAAAIAKDIFILAEGK